MGFRKSGTFQPAQEILIETCDVCERDIGYEDGRRPAAHLRVSRHPNSGSMDSQEPAAMLCSRECLRAYAENMTDLARESLPSDSSGPGRGSRRKKRNRPDQ
jgi:hypothetical protein